MTRSSNLSVARAVAFRTVTALLRNPALFIPPMLFPLMSFAAFAGGLSRLSQIPDFDYAAGYTSFQFVFVLLQSASSRAWRSAETGSTSSASTGWP